MAGLGRRVPTDWEHVNKYPYATVAPQTLSSVNRVLRLPVFRKTWDQGNEGACVGFGTSMMLSIVNQAQASSQGLSPVTRQYDPWWLWDRAKEIDEWPDTNPGDSEGTSVRAACDVLRTVGHTRVVRGKDLPVDAAEGISTNRWATSVDEMRTCIGNGIPVSIGINWYSDFDDPDYVGSEYWIGRNSEALGNIRGGHCVCLYGASDKRQAFRVCNSWGESYPLVWLPYGTMQRLLNEDGEATLVVDR